MTGLPHPSAPCQEFPSDSGGGGILRVGNGGILSFFWFLAFLCFWQWMDLTPVLPPLARGSVLGYVHGFVLGSVLGFIHGFVLGSVLGYVLGFVPCSLLGFVLA